MITVRGTRPDDGDALEELRGEARTEAADKRGGPELLDDLTGTTDDSPTVSLVALIGEVPVGLATATERRGSLRISELFVSAAVREVGVGTMLLSRLLETAEELACGRVESVALPGDRSTKNFFESHGLTARRIIVGRSVDP